MPGFMNKKYDQDFLVSARRHSDRIYHAREFKLRSEPVDSGYLNYGTRRCNRTGPSHDPSANRNATGLTSRVRSPVAQIRKN